MTSAQTTTPFPGIHHGVTRGSTNASGDHMETRRPGPSDLISGVTLLSIILRRAAQTTTEEWRQLLERQSVKRLVFGSKTKHKQIQYNDALRRMISSMAESVTSNSGNYCATISILNSRLQRPLFIYFSPVLINCDQLGRYRLLHRQIYIILWATVFKNVSDDGKAFEPQGTTYNAGSISIMYTRSS